MWERKMEVDFLERERSQELGELKTLKDDLLRLRDSESWRTVEDELENARAALLKTFKSEHAARKKLTLDEKRQLWRYPNLSPLIEQNLKIHYLGSALKQTESIRGAEEDLLRWARRSVFDMDQTEICSTFMYGLGYSLDVVKKAIYLDVHRWLQQLLFARLVLVPHVSNKEYSEEFAYSFRGQISFRMLTKTILLNDIDLLIKAIEAVKCCAREMPPPLDDMRFDMLGMADLFTGRRISESWKKARKTSDPWARWPRIDMLFARSEDEFNKLLQEVIASRWGSERTRKRKRSAGITEVFLYEYMLECMAAVWVGVPVTVKDVGMPFHDFPVSRNERFRKLLPL